jgi:hypothetical protein
MASSDLLKQIQAGKRLKQSVTHDRSAPVIDGKKPNGGSSGSAGPRSGPSVAPSPMGAGGPPQLGGLFAGGMPKLKPAARPAVAGA